MERKYFEINGYWKDDETEIEGYVVTNYDDCEEGVDDDAIFFYGMSEDDIKAAIEVGEDDDNFEFVITSYSDITETFK